MKGCIVTFLLSVTIAHSPVHAMHLTLRQAVLVGNVAQAECAIDTGTDLEQEDAWGLTNLMTAVVCNDVEMVRLLIKKGAHVNHSHRSLGTALHLTPRKVLLQHNKTSNTRSFSYENKPEPDTVVGRIPLYYKLYHPNRVQIVQMLLEAGADIYKKDNKGRTVLHIAAELKCYGILELALKKANQDGQLSTYINLPDTYRKPALHYACALASGTKLLDFSDKEFMQQMGAFVVQDPSQTRPKSTDQTCVRIATLLAKHGADINQQSLRGRTALHSAVETNNAGLVHYLVDQGAVVTLEDDGGRTPYQYASNDAVRIMLFKAGASVPRRSRKFLFNATLVEAAGEDDLATIKKFLPEIENINCSLNSQGDSLLRVAACQKTSKVARFLLAHGASQYSLDTLKNIPLLYTADNGDAATIRTMLTCPQNGVWFSPKEIYESEKRIFTFLCCLKRIFPLHGVPFLPPTVLYKILSCVPDDMACAPIPQYWQPIGLDTFIQRVPLKTQKQLAQSIGEKKFIQAHTQRHMRLVDNLLKWSRKYRAHILNFYTAYGIAQEAMLVKQADGYHSEAEEYRKTAALLNPETVESLRPMVRANYEAFFTTKKINEENLH